jgi:hypothetical protein
MQEMGLMGVAAVEEALRHPTRDMLAPEALTALTEAPLRQVRLVREE